MNILVTGANGQLGSEIRVLSANYPGYVFYLADSAALDVTNASQLEEFLLKSNINSIINCAAYTAVDKAEAEKEVAYAVNSTAVGLLTGLAVKNDLQLIHISTDYVFNGRGDQPYLPNDEVDPVNYYGESKREGEKHMLQSALKNSLIIRTSWLYSSFGKNFVKSIMRLAKAQDTLAVIDDQVGSPTYAQDLARFILEKALHFKSDAVGVYQYRNEGVCSWYDFAKAIVDLTGLNCQIRPITSQEYATIAKRPFYSVMSTYSLKSDFNTDIPYWRDSLKSCLNFLKEVEA